MKHGHLGVHSPWEALSPQRDQQLIENGQQSSMTAPSGKRPFHDLAKASLRWTEKNIFGSKYGPQNGVQNWITFSFHFLSLCLGPGPRFGSDLDPKVMSAIRKFAAARRCFASRTATH